MNIKKTLAMSVCVMMSGMVLGISAFAGKEEVVADDYSEYNGYQCVTFVRELVPDLPTKLYTNQAKMNLIKYGIDVCPESGWVAIVNNGAHVAYVEDANEDDGTITVVTLDGNWIGGKVYRRTGTPSELKINGYWTP